MKRSNKGFTLVEILIVVIILGILAAIVIPQFTEASQDARNSQLTSDLQTLRSQLELYKVQHLELYPSGLTAVGTDSTKFAAQMTSKTNADGTTSGGTQNLGPYMQKMPTNPFVASNGNVIKVGAAACPADGSSGWYFDTTLNKLSANDSAHSGL
ncbi:MAG: prepilin-type N-terminal cleavage/methylation domain-containing protein [Planctomycetaceae bacterium]|nr:MAG: prepilin-type N-terminal cleavage/methylation domain-containing protein [Planctomycetaceae bacterium]